LPPRRKPRLLSCAGPHVSPLPLNEVHFRPAAGGRHSDVDDVTSMFDPTDPDFSDKAKYMQANECCVMQVGPDGKARAVRLDLQGSSFVDKNNYFLNYVGRYMAPAP
jgi:hypothetical protein